MVVSVSIAELSADVELNSALCLVIWSHLGHMLSCEDRREMGRARAGVRGSGGGRLGSLKTVSVIPHCSSRSRCTEPDTVAHTCNAALGRLKAGGQRI